MRYIVAHALYWLGDIVSRWNDNDIRFTVAGWKLYQWLMAQSRVVQGEGSGPWQPVPPQGSRSRGNMPGGG